MRSTILVAIAAAALSGCKPTAAPSVQVVAPARAVPVASPPPSAAPSPTAPPAGALAGDASAPGVAPSAAPGAAQTLLPTTPPVRITILTPGGPLIVDVWIKSGGQPIDAARGDGDDGNAPAVTLRTSRSYEPDPRSSSRVWPLVDENSDGRLSDAELAAAPDRLWSRDVEDDRVLAVAELASLRDQLEGDVAAPMGAARAPGPAGGRLAAILLDAKADFERVEFVLQDTYAPLQELTAASFTDLPDLFAELDLDGDGWIDVDELRRLNTTAAHVALEVSFPPALPTAEASPKATAPPEPAAAPAPSEPGTDDSPAPTVELLRYAPEVAVLLPGASQRVVIALGRTRLAISAHDISAAPQRQPAPGAAGGNVDRAAAPLRVLVHDRGDGIFDCLDANADGRLGEREIAAAGERLRERDKNADDVVAADEAPYLMTLALVRGAAVAGSSPFATPPLRQLRAAAAVLPWFAAADLNHDGDVSRREFLGAGADFASLDVNGDGYIEAREAAEARTN